MLNENSALVKALFVLKMLYRETVHVVEHTASTLHFHPDVQLKISGNDIYADSIRIKLEGFRSFTLEKLRICLWFQPFNGSEKS